MMHHVTRLSLILLILTLNTAAPTKQPRTIPIRVLLNEESIATKHEYLIQSRDGFILETKDDTGKKFAWKEPTLHLIAHNNLFFIHHNNSIKKLKCTDLFISPKNYVATINGNTYEGKFNIRCDEKQKAIQLINKIDLDDYIYSVLRFESLSYWPHEMHKVQAIASRTYAVYQIKQARQKNNQQAYDIKNTNIHQVYNGLHDCNHLRKAVYDTHNLILTYNGTIALTMFDICCGGIVPAHMKRKDLDKPYLYRANQCVYCRGKQSFEWQHSLHKKDFWTLLETNPRITKKVKGLGYLRGISVKEVDKAGIVQKIIINGSRKNVSLTRNELKSSLATAHIKSDVFHVHKKNDGIEFKGFGFGHHTGLCQIGARELVSRGWQYTAILDFYFPNTKLARIKRL